MRVIGVDPGLADSGYGVVEERDRQLSVVEFSTISTSKDTPFPERLRLIHDEFTRVLREFQPEACAVEAIYFAKNAKSAFQVGHARAVFILCASLAGIPVFEYTPIQIKKALVGVGRAEKSQVQYMTKMVLRLEEPPWSDHAADALAVAICHINSSRFSAITGGQRVVYGRRR
ncbi:MAG TPA: crossover junction endodeoxyribonuclease RuvC [bacterium]|nr:crossover junction endodeoxyribonuclease RuvC [bacterium]